MFFFAWVLASETTFGVEHQIEGEEVFAFRVDHAEGEFASLSIDIRNPRIGLLAPARKTWAWLSWNNGAEVVPLFFGGLVGVPSDLHQEIVTLQFTARPADYNAQKHALAEALKVAPFYPAPPPAVLVPTLVENDHAFGAHSIIVAKRYLWPAAVQNAQVFGNNAVGLAPTILEQATVESANVFGAPAIQNLAPGVRHLFPAKLINAGQFGTAQVRISNRYLVQVRVVNVSEFGAPRLHAPPQLLTHSQMTNSNQFRAHTIGGVEKTFSYSNPLGSGNRTGAITVTTSGGTVFDSPSKLVNGNLTENAFWGHGAITFKFDLGTAKVIRQSRWIQNTATTHTGLFRWQGSNDDASYFDIGGTFNLGGSTTSLCNTLADNNTAYRYYRLVPTAGASISGTPYLREIEFYIEGSIDDPPD